MNESPDEIEALLPWYAAGALSYEDRVRVETALEARPELRLSLATLEEDRDETVALNQTLGAPRADVWARIAQAATPRPLTFGLAPSCRWRRRRRRSSCCCRARPSWRCCAPALDRRLMRP